MTCFTRLRGLLASWKLLMLAIFDNSTYLLWWKWEVATYVLVSCNSRFATKLRPFNLVCIICVDLGLLRCISPRPAGAAAMAGKYILRDADLQVCAPEFHKNLNVRCDLPNLSLPFQNFQDRYSPTPFCFVFLLIGVLPICNFSEFKTS